MTTDTDSPPTNPASLIAALADRFPAAFVAEGWQPHKPLAIGVDHHLIATGLLTPAEVRTALSSYVSRRMYLTACSAGTVRIDLDGKPAGEVTPREAEWAAAKLSRLDARAAPRATIKAKPTAAARARIEPRRATVTAAERRHAARASHKGPGDKMHVQPSHNVRRDGLADLRRAAAARRAVTVDAPAGPPPP